MNILILLKNAHLDESIVNFTASVFKNDAVKLHLLNLVEVNGEIPTKPNGEVLDFCTEFDLSGYHTTASKNLNYLSGITNKLIVSRKALVGNRIKLIQHYIKENSIDLIVGGAHKTSRIEDLFIKTFSSSIIEKIDLPCLTIKCNRDQFKPNRIGIVRSFLNPKIENLAVIKKLVEFHNSTVVLIKIMTKDEKRLDSAIQTEMERFAQLNNLNPEYLIVNQANKEKGVEAIVKEELVDLIAIEKSHSTNFPSLHREEKDTYLVNHIYAPILIY